MSRSGVRSSRKLHKEFRHPGLRAGGQCLSISKQDYKLLGGGKAIGCRIKPGMTE
jgi:hypothetical protein